MPCSVLKLPNGTVAIVKHARGRRTRCACCPAWSGFLCDFELAPGKSCDRPLCGRHAIPVGPDRHVCPTHHADSMVA